MRKAHLSVVLLLTAVLFGQDVGKPLSKQDIADLITGVSERRVITWVEKCGIDFEATPDYLQTLRTLGVTDDLLKAIYAASVKRSAQDTKSLSAKTSESPPASSDTGKPPPSVAPAEAKRGALAPKAKESNREGLALIAKVVAALGGAEKVQAVKSLSTKATAIRKTPMGEIPIELETVTVFPDTSYQKLQTPMGDRLVVVSPGASFMGMGGQTGDMPAALKEESLKQLKRTLLYVAQHASDPKYVFVANGSEKIGDVEAKIVDIDADGAEARWFVDPQSGKVLRTAFHAAGMGGPALQQQDNSDWRTVDGISLPFKQAVKVDGQDAGSNEMKELVINPKVDPKLFERPAETKP